MHKCRLKEKTTEGILLLQLTLDSSVVKNQDAFYVLSGISVSPEGRRIALDYLKGNWSSIVQTFGGGQFLLSRMIESAVNRVCKPEMVWTPTCCRYRFSTHSHE